MKKLFESLLLFLCCILITGCGKSKDKLLETVNQSELSGQFFETQILENMEIRNFNIVSDGNSYISFDVVNMSENIVNIEFIKVLLYDVDNNLILETYGYVGNLQSTETKKIGIDVDGVISNVDRILCERM